MIKSFLSPTVTNIKAWVTASGAIETPGRFKSGHRSLKASNKETNRLESGFAPGILLLAFSEPGPSMPKPRVPFVPHSTLDTVFKSRSQGNMVRIKRLPRFDYSECNMKQLSHHGAHYLSFVFVLSLQPLGKLYEDWITLLGGYRWPI